jgi:hypothetical protein
LKVPPAFHYDGPNAGLVNEVIEFAFGDRVFSASGPDERRESVLLISDMRRAVSADGGQEPENYFPVERAAMQALMNSTNLSDDDLQFNWQDLRSNQIAKLIWTTQYYEWRKAHSEALRCVQSLDRDNPRPLFDHLVARLLEGPRAPGQTRGYCRGYVAHSAADSLRLCAENRAFNGRTDNHWERLFQTYQAGLWPCGWYGTWPAPGVLMAWHRPQQP